jgi:flagellar hook-associated protein 1
MSGLSQILQIGLSGLSAATEAMQTVSNNTANVDTAGYDVEFVDQTELPGLDGGAGSGALVTSIEQAFDQFLYQQGVQATSANQSAQIVQTNAQNLAALFPTGSSDSSGLGAAIDSFFSAANTVAQDPSNAADQEAFLGQAQSLAVSFNALGGQIASAIGGVDSEATSAVQQANSLTQQVAQLNQQISAQAGSPAGPPNSLIDQRNQLVQQLGQQLGVTTVSQANGSVDVYTAGGAALVNGSTAYRLGLGQSEYGDGAITITDAATGQDLTASLSGGELGGLLASRAQLVGAQNSVGALAAGLAAAVNTQQSLGLDQNGNLGQPLFSVAGPAVYASQNNTGTGTLTASIADPAKFTPGDFILTDTSNGFEATNTTTGQVAALGKGPTLSFDGLTVKVSGTVAVGDSFEIEPTATAAQTLTATLGNPTGIATASPYVATPGSNTGNVTATVGAAVGRSTLPANTIVLPASDFGQTLTVQFTSNTAFNIVSSNNKVIASGTLKPSSGAEIAIAYPSPAPAGEVVPITLSAGTAAKGDSFTFSPGGSGSNGNISALSGLANQNLVSGQTLDSYYIGLVATVGSQGQNAENAAQATQAVLTQAQNAQQSVSGVDLDQQAADLVSYQQAYQAAAQVISTAETVFQNLIAALQAA